MADLAELTLLINSSQATQAETALDKMTASATKAEQAAGKLTQATNQTNTANGQGSAVAQKLAASFEGLQSRLIQLTAGVGVFALSFKSIEQYAKFEVLEAGFATIMQSADNARKFVADFQQQMGQVPFDMAGLEGAAQRILQFSTSAKTAADVIPQLKLAMDFTAIHGGSTQEVGAIALQLEQLSEGARKAGRAVMQLQSEGIPVVKYLMQSLNATDEYVQNALQKGLIKAKTMADSITTGMARDNAGGLQRYADTLQGKWDIAGQSFNLMLAKAGGAIVQVFNLKGALDDVAKVIEAISGGAGMDRFRVVLEGVAVAAKATLMVFEGWAALQIVGIFKDLWINAVQLPVALGAANAAASPLLVVVTSIGAAIGAWTVGQRLFDQFKEIRQLGAGMATWFQDPAEAARIGGEGLQFPNRSYAINAKGQAVKYLDPSKLNEGQVLQLGSVEDTYARNTLGISKEPNSLGSTTGFGADFVSNFKSIVDTMTGVESSALSKMFKASDLSKMVTDMVTATDKAKASQQGLNQAQKTGLDTVLEQLKAEQAYAGLRGVTLQVAQKVTDLRNTSEDFKAYGQGSPEEAAAIQKITDAYKALAAAKDSRQVDYQLQDIQHEQQLLKYYGDELTIQKQLYDLYLQMHKDGVKADPAQAKKAEAEIRQNQELIEKTEELRQAADGVGKAFGTAFDNALFSGKSFADTLKALLQDIEKSIVDAFITKPMEQGIGKLFFNLGQSLGLGGGSGVHTDFGGSGGGSGAGGDFVVPHALGTVLNGPAYFHSAGQLHVAGEAGPEAIIPLAKTADGRLGVTAAGGNGGGNAAPVVHNHYYTINIQSASADDGMRRSKVQAAAAARRALGA